MHSNRRPVHPQANATGAVGALMRLVGRLTVDANGDPRRLEAHRHYVAGYLTALEAARVLPPTQLLSLQHTCEVLLEGTLTLQDLRAMKTTGNDTDPVYQRAVSLVRRAGHADEALLASQLDCGKTTARQLVARMQTDGLVSEPDLFGIHSLKVSEVGHG